jgi:hypothetical protein
LIPQVEKLPGIADNKIALNAGWHLDLLRVELSELNVGFDLSSLTGFCTGELDVLLNGTADPAERVRYPGFDIDAVTDADLAEMREQAPPLTMADLDRVISAAALRPPGVEVSPMGIREYRFRRPGLGPDVRMSTDPAYYEENADTVELWSPGNPTFPMAQGEVADGEDHGMTTLAALLPEAMGRQRS